MRYHIGYEAGKDIIFLRIIICYDVISTINWFYTELIYEQVFAIETEHTYYEENHPFDKFRLYPFI